MTENEALDVLQNEIPWGTRYKVESMVIPLFRVTVENHTDAKDYSASMTLRVEASRLSVAVDRAVRLWKKAASIEQGGQWPLARRS